MNLNKTLIATMATGVTTTSAIPVVGWKKASIEVATFAVGFAGASVAMNVKVSNELDGTYRPLQKFVNSGSTILAANVAVQAQTGPYVIEITEVTNFNYMKLDTDTATSNAVGIRVNFSN